MMQIASAYDVAHSSMSGNYKGSTWTSSRTALLDERDGWKRLQNWFSEHFLDDVFENWLKMSLLSGILNPLPSKKYDKFNEPFWYGRIWEWVDPDNEVNAKIKQFKYKFQTFGDISAERGKDLIEHIEELKTEEELFKEYGIDFPTDIPTDSISNDAVAGSSDPNSGDNNNNNNNSSTSKKRLLEGNNHHG